MRVSIALCTYNGERFLSEQLASIAAQTRLPDELVVCDDVSSDGTIPILEAFADDSPFPVRIHRNDRNIGSTQNFAQAISRCDGDVIFLCDQDDIWYPPKIERLCNELERNPDKSLIFTDADLVDADGQSLNRTVWQSVGFNAAARHDMLAGKPDLLFSTCFVTGATAAFRTSWRDFLLPIPNCWVHDAWIAFLIHASGGCIFIDDSLIAYRQHSQQQIGAPLRQPPKPASGLAALMQSRNTIPRFIDKFVPRLTTALERLESRHESETSLLLRDYLKHLHARKAARQAYLWRAWLVGREITTGRYMRFGNGIKSAIADLLA